ncbi:hypothetical protein Tdes44962_MAKER10204 [Teratosphaeria destructans]|uniref:Uncharacterized protein n=1 Tax=Teratosphaeria destructans TaxID=418781 RepID=A0A9W7SN38_9PEZI|nr:hypothetical protein Tdes44962_MAKER10204 [Teratosphaeria destructans]
MLAQLAELPQTCLRAGTGDVLVLAIELEGIGGVGGRAGGGGVGAEVVLGEGDGEGGVGGEVQFGVPLSPVSGSVSDASRTMGGTGWDT